MIVILRLAFLISSHERALKMSHAIENADVLQVNNMYLTSIWMQAKTVVVVVVSNLRTLFKSGFT